MTSGDGGPSHHVIVTRGGDKSLNIGEKVECKRHLLFQCRKMFAFHTTQSLFSSQSRLKWIRQTVWYMQRAHGREINIHWFWFDPLGEMSSKYAGKGTKEKSWLKWRNRCWALLYVQWEESDSPPTKKWGASTWSWPRVEVLQALENGKPQDRRPGTCRSENERERQANDYQSHLCGWPQYCDERRCKTGNGEE